MFYFKFIDEAINFFSKENFEGNKASNHCNAFKKIHINTVDLSGLYLNLESAVN